MRYLIIHLGFPEFCGSALTNEFRGVLLYTCVTVYKNKGQFDSFRIKDVLAHQLKAERVKFRDYLNICMLQYACMWSFLGRKTLQARVVLTVFSVWIVRIEIFVALAG